MVADAPCVAHAGRRNDNAAALIFIDAARVVCRDRKLELRELKNFLPTRNGGTGFAVIVIVTVRLVKDLGRLNCQGRIKKDPAALSAFIDQTAAVVTPGGSQTDGKPPAGQVDTTDSKAIAQAALSGMNSIVSMTEESTSVP